MAGQAGTLFRRKNGAGGVCGPGLHRTLTVVSYGGCAAAESEPGRCVFDVSGSLETAWVTVGACVVCDRGLPRIRCDALRGGVFRGLSGHRVRECGLLGGSVFALPPWFGSSPAVAKQPSDFHEVSGKEWPPPSRCSLTASGVHFLLIWFPQSKSCTQCGLGPGHAERSHMQRVPRAHAGLEHSISQTVVWLSLSFICHNIPHTPVTPTPTRS